MLEERTAAAVADFNEDGRMDVALASDRWTLTRFLMTETGQLADWALVTQQPDFFVSADVNGDRHADLVAVKGQEP